MALDNQFIVNKPSDCGGRGLDALWEHAPGHQSIRTGGFGTSGDSTGTASCAWIFLHAIPKSLLAHVAALVSFSISSFSSILPQWSRSKWCVSWYFSCWCQRERIFVFLWREVFCFLFSCVPLPAIDVLSDSLRFISSVPVMPQLPHDRWPGITIGFSANMTVDRGGARVVPF